MFMLIPLRGGRSTVPRSTPPVSAAPVIARVARRLACYRFVSKGRSLSASQLRMDSSGRLLIVDDDAGVRAMLTEYLGGHRYDVRVADSGTAMRAEIERDLPDLVLLDIRMPGEDGLTLARFLREHYDVGIIMVTASGDVVDRVVGLEIGADDYVAKPFDPRELLARVKSVLRRMQARAKDDAGAPPPGSAEASVAGRVPFGRCLLDVESRACSSRAASRSR
jgi:two-component system phosphate regulon response regulator OmpR